MLKLGRDLLDSVLVDSNFLTRSLFPDLVAKERPKYEALLLPLGDFTLESCWVFLLEIEAMYLLTASGFASVDGLSLHCACRGVLAFSFSAFCLCVMVFWVGVHLCASLLPAFCLCL